MKKQNLLLLLFGIGIGFINGFMGGGGGILVVCVLLAVLNMEQKQAHATAIFIILPVSILSAIIYICNGSVDWLNTLYATIGVILGGVVGALLLNKIQGKAVKIVFAVILMLAGVRMFFGA